MKRAIINNLSGEVLIFGVGDITLAHKPIEYIKVNEYKKYSELFINLIKIIENNYEKNQ